MRFSKSKRSRRASAHFAVSKLSGNRIPFGLGMRLLYEKWRYGHLAPFMVHERGPPSFYSEAKPNDVEDFEISPVGRGIDGHLPLGFEAYVWLPNPAWKWVESTTDGAVAFEMNDQESLMALPIKWSDVAEANGKHMHKNARWGEICGPCTENWTRALSPSQNWTWAPQEQNIEQSTVDVLAKMLTQWTSPDDRCLSGKWEGGSDWDTNIKLAFAHWTYYVWSCRFCDLMEWLMQPESYERSSEMPHVVWPQDRSWFLAILYSGFSSYVAGPRHLIEAILDSDLEAYEVEPSDQPH